MDLEAQQAREVGAAGAAASVQTCVTGDVMPSHRRQANTGTIEGANSGLQFKRACRVQLGLGEDVNPKASVAGIVGG